MGQESNTTPKVGSLVRAVTTTRTEQRVIIEVTAIDVTTHEGTYVWGYRQGGKNKGRRQTIYPNLYLIPQS